MTQEAQMVQEAQRGKQRTSISITTEAKEIWEALADYYGLSQSAIIEMMLREEARSVGLLETEVIQLQSRKKP